MMHLRTNDIKLQAEISKCPCFFQCDWCARLGSISGCIGSTAVSHHRCKHARPTLQQLRFTLQLAYEILLPSFAILHIIYPLVHDFNQFSTQLKIEGFAYVSVLIQGSNPGIIKSLGRGGVHQVARQHTEDKQPFTLTFTPKVCLK